MLNQIKLNNTIITENSIPYIIAEIGVNHEGSLDTAKLLIDQAVEGGASAVKFQTYKADKIVVQDSPYYWDLSEEPTKSQFDLFKKYDVFNYDDYQNLALYAKSKSIDFISTPFDVDAVDFLDNIVEYFKISSSDITNVPLLRRIASKGKPIVLSTGSANLEEVKNAVNIILDINSSIQLSLLHCVLNYPTLNTNANLNYIGMLKKHFPNLIVGYSDHTLPDINMHICVSSYLLGARIIEKHFTHNKKLKGNDHYHSMDVSDLKVLVKNLKYYSEILGSENKKIILNSEKLARKNARRSIYAKSKIKKGEYFTENNLITKRPIKGIPASEWDSVIGKKSKKDLIEDDPIITDIIDEKI